MQQQQWMQLEWLCSKCCDVSTYLHTYIHTHTHTHTQKHTYGFVCVHLLCFALIADLKSLCLFLDHKLLQIMVEKSLFSNITSHNNPDVWPCTYSRYHLCLKFLTIPTYKKSQIQFSTDVHSNCSDIKWWHSI